MRSSGHKDKKTEAFASKGMAEPGKKAHGLLVVIDGTEHSQHALEMALGLCMELGKPLLAMYVVDTAAMEYLVRMRVILPSEREMFRKDMEKKGERYLQNAVAVAATHGVTLETVITTGHFDQSVLEFVRKRAFDLVLIGGSRHANTWDEAVHARQLLMDRMPCPLLVVK